MLQLVPQLRILLAVEPVDFRKGIDSLAALCRDQASGSRIPTPARCLSSATRMPLR
jgi:hypothetical protein